MEGAAGGSTWGSSRDFPPCEAEFELCRKLTAEPARHGGWELIEEAQFVRVWTRVEGDLRLFRVYQLPIAVVARSSYALKDDLEFFQAADSGIADVRVVEEDLQAEESFLYYAYKFPPGISNRDFLVGKACRANADGTFETMNRSALHDSAPARKRFIRAYSMYYSKLVPTGPDSHEAWNVFGVDLKGDIPRALVTKLAIKGANRAILSFLKQMGAPERPVEAVWTRPAPAASSSIAPAPAPSASSAGARSGRSAPTSVAREEALLAHSADAVDIGPADRSREGGWASPNASPPSSDFDSLGSIADTLVTALLSDDSEASRDKAPWRYSLDLTVLAVGSLATYTGFNGAQRVELTLFDDIGVNTQGTIYAAGTAMCVFAPVLVKTAGARVCILAQLLFLSIWIGIHLSSPSYSSVMSAAVLCGLGATPWAVALGVVITRMSFCFDAAKQQRNPSRSRLLGPSRSRTLGVFNGAFFFFFQMTQAIGNALSAAVLGHDYSRNSPERVTQLFSLYSGCGAAGFLLLLTSLKVPPKVAGAPNRQGSCATRLAETFLVLRDARIVLLIPLCVYCGVGQAFFYGTFGAQFVRPTFGAELESKLSIVVSASTAVSALVVGRLSDSIGRWSVTVIGFVSHVGCLVALLLWKEHQLIRIEDDARGLVAMVALSVVWGLGEAAFLTQLNAIIGNYFGRTDDLEAAFAACQLFKSLMATLGLLVGESLSTHARLIVALCSVGVAVGSTGILHFFVAPLSIPQRRSNRLGFRTAWLADAAAITRLSDEVETWLASRGNSQPLFGALSPVPLETALENGEVTMATIDGQVVGCAALSWENRQVWPDIQSGEAGYVDRLMTRRGRAYRGVGLELLRHMESQVALAGRKTVRVHMWSGSKFLRQYFVGAGYESAGTVQLRSLPGVGRASAPSAWRATLTLA